MKSNLMKTAWAMIIMAFSIHGCKESNPSPAEQPTQAETVYPAEAGADSANQAAVEKPQPEVAAQENVPNTEPDTNGAHEGMPEANTDAPKESLTVSDWNQYHLAHCWPYQKDEQCNEADWERFHDYLKNHALNYDSVRSLFLRYGDEIERTSAWYEEVEDSCRKRIEDEDGCYYNEEFRIWEALILDIRLIRSLNPYNHPKEQYALWKLLDEVETESDDEDKPHKSDEQFREELRALVKAGANVNDPNKDGIIPAFVIKDKIILRELIQSGVIEPKLTDERDRTLLHVLSERGDIDADFIKQLTAAGVDINARDDQGNTPLGAYLWENKPDESISQSFMEAGADIYAANKKGEIPLFKLPPDLVLKLIENGKIKLDDKDAHGNTLIHIFGHHAGLVNYAMKNGFDFASRNDKGEMPVFDMEASAVLELLKSQKISPDIRSNDGKTLLHIYGTHEELAKFLIDAGLDINAKDNDGNTVLHDKHLSLTTVQQLVKLGANINVQNKKGETPLMILCDDNEQNGSSSDLERLKKLMELGADVNIRDANGDDYVMRRLIHFPDNENDYFVDLFYQGDTNEILEHLQSAISYKFTKISKHFSKVYFKKLRYAIEYADGDACSATIDEVHDVGRDLEKLVPQLIDAGLDVHQEDKDTSMHLGAGDTYLFFDLPLACESLIQAGLKVNAKNKRGETPLHQSLGLEMMKTLIKAGADVNAKDDLGRTPLFYNIQKVEGDMCEYFHVLNKEVADYLLEAGANINEKDKDGRTVLFYIENDIEYTPGATLEYLAEHGIDLNAVDNEGKTALFALPPTAFFIYEESACQTYKSFIQNGGKLNVKDKFGRNVLFYKPQLVKCFKEIAARNPSMQLDIKALVNEPDNDGVKPLMNMRKGTFISPNQYHFGGISTGLRDYSEVVQSLIELGADIGCGLGGTLSEDMCVCGNLRYSQAEASQWTCLGDLLRCLQHDGCSLFGKKYPVATDLCDAGKSAINGYSCSERWKCDAESCDCHQIAIHSGDICVPGGVLASNNCIYETQDDYNNRTSRCDGKDIADAFIAKEESNQVILPLLNEDKVLCAECKSDYAKTCLTDIHSCIKECPKGSVFDITKGKCRKYKECDGDTIRRFNDLAMISCDFAALHGYDWSYGNDASWSQMFDHVEEDCAEDNDENDDKPKKDNKDAADDNATAPSMDKSSNINGDIPKGMRLGPCYDTVYYGYGIHPAAGDEGEGTDGGYYRIGTTLRCVSINGCSCGESTCQKYGQCIDGQCHYDDFYVDLMCYAKDSFVGDWYEDDEVDENFPITADSSGNCACNHTILNPGFNYKNEYLCSQYGWMCIKETGCRCGEVQCEPGSVCIAPGVCSQPVVVCSGRLNPRGECCENSVIDRFNRCCDNGIKDKYNSCCESGVIDNQLNCCKSGILDNEGTCCDKNEGIDNEGKCCNN